MRPARVDLDRYRNAPARREVEDDPGRAGGAGRATAFVRVGLALALVLVWLAAMGVGGPTFGKISEVSSNDQATFLPAEAESTRAQQEAARFQQGQAIPAVVVGEADPEQDAAALQRLGDGLSGVDGVERVLGPTPSEDGRAVQYIALISSGDDAEREAADVVADLRAQLDQVGGELDAGRWHVAGPAGFAADLGAAFAGIDGVLLLVALIVVFVILVLVYRSVLLPVLVLVTAMAALCAAILAVYAMAAAEWIQLNGQSQGILSILVIGATTDYCLLLVARQREELLVRQRTAEAVRAAVRGSFGAITASAVTVALALLLLLFSDLNSNRALGPVAAVGIAFAWLAALTLLPALLTLLGRVAFWPSAPSAQQQHRRQHRRASRGAAFEQPLDRRGEPIAGLEDDHGVWTRIGGIVARRARPVWLVTAGVLALLCVGLTQVQADGASQSEVLLGASDARDGQRMLAEHFDAGTGSPAQIVAPARVQDEAVEVVQGADGVAEASLTAEGGAPAGTPPMNLPPAQIDGRVLISATLSDPAESLEAERTVAELRERLHRLDGDVLVGGTAAQNLDTNETAQRDLWVIIPLVLLMLLVILSVLLRSVLLPVVLVAATVLSFGAALGLSALVFRFVLGFEGGDPTVPLYGFVFLVALGVDYTIFLMTRARQELDVHGTRAGVLRALTVTGGVITSAGVVLAATFAALAVIPLQFMVQLAFIVCLGVLLDTLVVRTLLIPALVREIGPRVWWPATAS